jgi:hypothetical protein
MTSKVLLALVVLCTSFSITYADASDHSTASDALSSSGTLAPYGRSFLLRGDFLSNANYQKLHKLANTVNARTGVHYDWRGFPKFKSHFDVQLEPSQYRSSSYARHCSKKLLEACKKNPDLIKKIKLTEEDIQLLKQGKTPRGKAWHHDGKGGRTQLVDKNEHSTDHVGGAKTWGQFDSKRALRLTALRWGSVAVFDIAASSAGLLAAGELDVDHFAQATTRAVAGGTAAFSTEYLIAKLLPQAAAPPPGWFHGIRILYGSPATWGGALSYAATRALVDYCWESYRLQQLQIQEQICREAESKARWQQLDSARTANDQALGDLLKKTDSTEGIQS